MLENNIQAFNAFNIKSDADGNVIFTFCKEDLKDVTYRVPVTNSY